MTLYIRRLTVSVNRTRYQNQRNRKNFWWTMLLGRTQMA